ncbi:type II toxin-antitoxin system RelE family toxin [Aliirhizobium smilacinae]|uniref:Type II toxin-antitoxin system RelE/ParE family toxin n=1 Tax=Aliirhizobium smilacinae TaxID=1395944 RepID=A0A5C4XRG5_9HYPH|nr:type II toxin-antitoxin system RelE/ParE family toxin [Rhizobium smilacinae]TNM65992.1 type II toxin-antitoxin system RelE/ParE family toxin [Rhizobium smilacinae]
MAWTIEYSTSAQKQAKRLDPVIRKRIRQFLDERLAIHENPRELGTALKGHALGGFWRYKVGDYRIICDIQDQKLVVLVVEVGHRREVYR